jgi:hypothetical protein
LYRLILVIKNLLNDAHFGCEGAKENTLDNFLTCENTKIKEHMKLIEEQGILEKDLNFD